MTLEEAEAILGPDTVADVPEPVPLSDAQLARLAALFAGVDVVLPETA